MSNDLMMWIGCNDPICGQAPGATFCGQAGPKAPEAPGSSSSFAEVLADSTETPTVPAQTRKPGPSSDNGLRADGGEPGARKNARGDNLSPVGDGEDPGIGATLVSIPTLPLQKAETKTTGQDPAAGAKASMTGTGRSAVAEDRSGRDIASAASDSVKPQRPAAGATAGSKRQTTAATNAGATEATAKAPRAAEAGATASSVKPAAGNDSSVDRAVSAAPAPSESQRLSGPAPSAKTAPQGIPKPAPAPVVPESSGIDARAAQALASVAPSDIHRDSRGASAGRPSSSPAAAAKAADRLAPDGASTWKEDGGKKTTGTRSARPAIAETEAPTRPGQAEASVAENRPHPDKAAAPAARTRLPGTETGDAHGGALPSRVDANADSVQSTSLTRTWAPRSADVPADVLRQVVDRLGAQLRNGASELRLTLKPESLGHLNLKIASDQNGVSVRIVAETAAAKEIIEANLGQLRADLSQQGLDIKALNVDVFTAHDQSQRDTDSRQFTGRRGQAPSVRDVQNADPLPAAAVAGGWDNGRHSLIGIYA